MSNPILSKLQTSPGDPPTNGSDNLLERETFLTESLKIIRKVITGRKSVKGDDVPDIAQNAALRLWKWQTKFEGKSSEMSTDDWKSFTARTAHNEVNRTLSKRNKNIEVPIDEFELAEGTHDTSSAETAQLVQTVWQGICKLSVCQRQALILSSIDLVLYLLQFGIDEDELLAEVGITKDVWTAIAARMPLTDSEIAEMVNLRCGKNQNGRKAGAVKKARFDARKRLKELMR